MQRRHNRARDMIILRVRPRDAPRKATHTRELPKLLLLPQEKQYSVLKIHNVLFGTNKISLHMLMCEYD